MVMRTWWGSSFCGQWSMTDDDTGRCDGPVLWDLANVIVREEKDGVSGLCDAGLPLGKAVEFLAHCWYPEVFQVGVVLEFLVLCNGCLVMGWTTPK
jgi:hypothetical protein